MGDLLNERRRETSRRIENLKDELKDSEARCQGKACVYTTGSFGRGEASIHSDLDLFIVGQSNKTPDKRSLLRRLDEILIKADLIECTRRLGIQEFSGDGEYLVHYTIDNLVQALGTPDDDADNTFTARLLLLLESRPLLEESVYRDAIEETIAAYWRDYEDHKNDFMPAFLANDILRLWRTLCVNYEARTSTDPPIKKAKRKLKNFKLKHSRLLTCYSALLYLLFVFSEKETVSPDDAKQMVDMKPTERLEWLSTATVRADVRDKLNRLLAKYEEFLYVTNCPEQKLIEQFLDRDIGREMIQEAYKFGDLVFETLASIGAENRFYRLLIV